MNHVEITLEDLDDTQEVYHNADISDEVMAQL
jgi:transcriptional/translational regulatory protein YebC/TACO1